MGNNTVYIYEEGACRGDEFSNKIKVDKDLLLTTLRSVYTKVVELKRVHKDDENAFEDAFEEMMDAELSTYTDYTLVEVLHAMVREDYFCNILNFLNSNIAKLEKNEAFVLNREESTIGVAFTAKDAVLACHDFDEEGW